jgi:hypothetical protein
LQWLQVKVPDHHKVRQHASVSAIAIRKRMHSYDAVVQPNGEFCGLAGLIFQPATRLVIDLPQLGSNRLGRHSDVGILFREGRRAWGVCFS